MGVKFKTVMIGVAAGTLMVTSLTPAAAAQPTAPLNPAVTAAAAGSFTVEWNAPASDGGNAITEYVVESNSTQVGVSHGSCETAGAGRSCVIAGLDNGIPYTFSIRAINNDGPSSAATTAPATALGVSTKPRDVVALPRDGAAAIEWAAPLSNGGAPITAYAVSTVPPSTGCTTDGGADRDCEIAGLSNGVEYTISVTATNMYGTSVASDPVTVTPRETPGAPLDVVAVPGNAVANVSWSPPLWDGGSPVTEYVAVTEPASDGCTVAAPQTACTIANLTNGMAYEVSVYAINVVGDGPLSAPAQVVPYTVPDAPTAVEAAPGDAEATVSWEPSAFDGGREVVGYEVTTAPASAGCSTLADQDNTCTLSGLTNGQEYSVTVTAQNLGGTSAASAPPALVTPRTKPDAPTNVEAVPGNGQATITWSAPVFNGGVALEGYEVVAIPGSHTCSTSAGTTTCMLTGLTNGQEYELTVVAVNVAGLTSDPATATFTNPLTVPTAPRAVQTTRGVNSVVVSWSPPASDGGRPVTLYTVSATPGGETCTTATLQCTVNNLQPGAQYNFTVVATNEAGTGLASTAVTGRPLNVPSQPRQVTAKMAGTSKSKIGKSIVRWRAPAHQGGTPVVGYYVRSGPATCFTTKRRCQLKGLVRSPMKISVEAVNAIGPSARVHTRSRVATTTARTEYKRWNLQTFKGHAMRPNKVVRILQRDANGSFRVYRKYRQAGGKDWLVDVRVPYGRSVWKVRQAGYTSPKLIVNR